MSGMKVHHKLKQREITNSCHHVHKRFANVFQNYSIHNGIISMTSLCAHKENFNAITLLINPYTCVRNTYEYVTYFMIFGNFSFALTGH